MSALFANMIIQQTNMALMFLGKVPHPETGETVRDVEAARMFIDQLEMLECKTKGNLDKREERLLRESLTTLRLAFVEVVDAQMQSGPSVTGADAAPPPPPATAQAQPTPGSAPAPSSASAEESHKKFTKKY